MINFRLDRFLTLYLFRHITKKQTSAGDKRIPILMYHSISDEKEKSHTYFMCTQNFKCNRKQAPVFILIP